jgi:hypothetical protein
LLADDATVFFFSVDAVFPLVNAAIEANMAVRAGAIAFEPPACDNVASRGAPL